MQGFHPWLQDEPGRVLDLCCGSGCIGIACGYAFEKAQIVLADICPSALQVAEQNILMHDMADRALAVQSDMFSALQGHSFDLIVCNPPYVDAQDYADMPAEYDHEPRLALTSGDDGLDFTRQLLVQAAEYLTESGLLVVEVGNSSVALQKAFPHVPFLWLEFTQGDGGVFVLTRQQLVENAQLLGV